MALREIIRSEIEQLRTVMVVTIGNLAKQVKADFIYDREQLRVLRNENVEMCAHIAKANEVLQERLAEQLDELRVPLKEFRHRIAQLEEKIEKLDTRLTMVAGNGNRMPNQGGVNAP